MYPEPPLRTVPPGAVMGLCSLARRRFTSYKEPARKSSYDTHYLTLGIHYPGLLVYYCVYVPYAGSETGSELAGQCDRVAYRFPSCFLLELIIHVFVLFPPSPLVPVLQVKFPPSEEYHEKYHSNPTYLTCTLPNLVVPKSHRSELSNGPIPHCDPG